MSENNKVPDMVLNSGKINLFESKAIEDKQFNARQGLSAMMVSSYKRCTKQCFKNNQFLEFKLSDKDKSCLSSCYDANFAVQDVKARIFWNGIVDKTRLISEDLKNR